MIQSKIMRKSIYFLIIYAKLVSSNKVCVKSLKSPKTDPVYIFETLIRYKRHQTAYGILYNSEK